MMVDRFGLLADGREVRRIVLGRPPGPVLHLVDLGATVHRLELTCGDGVRRNVVLGHATPEHYLASGDYLGATIGRYANRIAGGRFRLGGREVRLGAHDRGNHLHGGPDGFDRRMWSLLNLDGDGAGTVDEHVLQVFADNYTPVDADGIPLGGHAPVAGTPFDFREAAVLGPALRAGD